MDWSKYGNIAQVVQAAVVIATLVLVLFELRQSNALSRASNALRIQEMASPFTMALTKDVSLAKLWLVNPSELSQMNEIDQFRHRELVVWWLMLHEMVYYQHRKGLLDSDILAAWKADLNYFAARKLDDKLWFSCKEALEVGFSQYVEEARAIAT